MRDRKRACLLGQSGELFFPFDLANRSVTKNSLFRSELKKKFGIPRLPFFLPPTMDSELGSIAAQLVSDGGILASDESPPTLGKRLVKAGLENDEVIESFEFLFFSSSFSFLLASSQPQPRPLQLLLKKTLSRSQPAAPGAPASTAPSSPRTASEAASSTRRR